jgi:hypothetical protein
MYVSLPLFVGDYAAYQFIRINETIYRTTDIPFLIFRIYNSAVFAVAFLLCAICLSEFLGIEIPLKKGGDKK